MKSPEERGFLKSLRENSKDKATLLAYADWLDENGRNYEALKQRVKAGVSNLGFNVRQKSNGKMLFRKPYNRLCDLRYHFSYGYRRKNLDDLEVVVIELRIHEFKTLDMNDVLDGKEVL